MFFRILFYIFSKILKKIEIRNILKVQALLKSCFI